MTYEISDIELAAAGRQRLEYAARAMPVLDQVGDRFEAERPLDGLAVGACLPVTAAMSNLVRTLKRVGANVRLCACDPDAVEDDVAASLVRDHGVAVFARRGEDGQAHHSHVSAVLDGGTSVVIDSGAKLVITAHTFHRERGERLFGATVQGPSGLPVLRALAGRNLLMFPIVAANESRTSHLFDDRYQVAPRPIDGSVGFADMSLCGRVVVVAGYTSRARDMANRARATGAHVVVTEVEPSRAVEAVMDGFRAMPVVEAARLGDVFFTAGTDPPVPASNRLYAMKNGATVITSDYVGVQKALHGLSNAKIVRSASHPKAWVCELRDGRKIHVMVEREYDWLERRDPTSAVTDMVLANHALSVEYLTVNAHTLTPEVRGVPEQVDHGVARLKLALVGIGTERRSEPDGSSSW